MKVTELSLANGSLALEVTKHEKTAVLIWMGTIILPFCTNKWLCSSGWEG